MSVPPHLDALAADSTPATQALNRGLDDKSEEDFSVAGSGMSREPGSVRRLGKRPRIVPTQPRRPRTPQPMKTWRNAPQRTRRKEPKDSEKPFGHTDHIAGLETKIGRHFE